MAVDQIKLPDSATLRFTHTAIRRPLLITTGANSIKWSYNLNTTTTPTYGGEVVQILSAFVGPVTITGNSRDNNQLKLIYDWFRQYMVLAGGMGRGENYNRVESPVLFEYPERGWSFYLQINDLPDFRYAVDEIAVPWSITAEMYAGNKLNALSKYTMSTFTSALLKESLQKVGFSSRDIRIDPTNPVSANMDSKTMADNMQRLIAAYVTGDYNHWGFDIAGDPTKQFNGTADEIYEKAFGTAYLIDAGNDNSSSGSATYGGSDNPDSQACLAQLIKTEFEAKGVPARLGVAVAMVESGGNTGLNPDARQTGGDRAVGLFQTFPRGAGGSRSNSRQLQQAYDSSGKVTEYYTARMQAKAAAEWFADAKPDGWKSGDSLDFEKAAKWAQRAQGAGVAYDNESEGKPKFRTAWGNAGRLLQQPCQQATSSGNVFRQRIVEYANQCLSQAGNQPYSSGGRYTVKQKQPTKGKLYSTDCSGWVTALYGWATDWNRQYDPNGSQNNYSGAYTGTMYSAENGMTIRKENAKAGDIVVYGPQGTASDSHVNIFLEDWRGPETRIAGFGSNGGPRSYSFGSDGKAGNSRWPSPVTVRKFFE